MPVRIKALAAAGALAAVMTGAPMMAQASYYCPYGYVLYHHECRPTATPGGVVAGAVGTAGAIAGGAINTAGAIAGGAVNAVLGPPPAYYYPR